MQPCVVFVKLGGSLITQKKQAHTARPEVIARLAEEIARAVSQRVDLRILLGHGSGSFGHHAAAKYGTRAGVHSPQDWNGFAEVWHEARALNHLVVEALAQAGLPVVAFPPSAWLLARDGKVDSYEISPLARALEHGLLPVVQGDVIFDSTRGGTILSTEDVFAGLVAALKPERILLAGIEEGVWSDYPDCTRLIPTVSHADAERVGTGLRGSAHLDVTGGMREKVLLMLSITQAFPEISAQIFSGSQPGNLYRCLMGESMGTTIRA